LEGGAVSLSCVRASSDERLLTNGSRLRSVKLRHCVPDVLDGNWPRGGCRVLSHAGRLNPVAVFCNLNFALFVATAVVVFWEGWI